MIVPPPPKVVFPCELDSDLAAILKDESIDPKFGQWMADVGLTSVKRFGKRIQDESEVEVTFIDEANRKYADCVGTEGDIAAVKLAWQACRDKLDKGMLTDDVQDDTKPMGTKKFESLNTAWSDHHHFLFTAKHILTLTLTNKLYKHATASPKQFCILIPDELKLRASVCPKMSQTISKPGEPLYTEALELDPCTSHQILFKRIIALMNTWALVSIEDPSWFCYQDVRDFTDIFEELYHRRYNGQRPTLDFMVKAYLKMCGYFLDQINTFGKTLSECVSNTVQWEPMWTAWSPPAQKPTTMAPAVEDTGAGAATIMELDPSLTQKMNSIHKMARSLLRNGKNSKGKGDKGAGKGGGKQGWQWKNGNGNGKWRPPKGKGKGKHVWKPAFQKTGYDSAWKNKNKSKKGKW